MASFVPGSRGFCARPEKRAVEHSFISKFTTEGDDYMQTGDDRGLSSLGITPASASFDLLVDRIVVALVQDGVAHVRTLFPPGVVGAAIEAALATRPTEGEDLMRGRYEYFIAGHSKEYDLLELAPGDLIRRVCAEFSGERETTFRSSIVTASAGAGLQSFHRDRSAHSTLPRLLYAFASPLQLPIETGASTTFIPGSHVDPDIDPDDADNHWRVYMDDGDLLLFFAHVLHRGDGNRTAQDRPILSAIVDVVDRREYESIDDAVEKAREIC